jgi:hypothetical protein
VNPVLARWNPKFLGVRCIEKTRQRPTGLIHKVGRLFAVSTKIDVEIPCDATGIMNQSMADADSRDCQRGRPADDRPYATVKDFLRSRGKDKLVCHARRYAERNAIGP